MQQENHKLLRVFAMATNAPLEPGVSDYMQSNQCTFLVTDRAPKGSPVNGRFNKLKKLSYTLVGGHAIYTMACNSNAAADATGSWLSSKNSPHQTIHAHMENELLR